VNDGPCDAVFGGQAPGPPFGLRCAPLPLSALLFSVAAAARTETSDDYLPWSTSFS